MDKIDRLRNASTRRELARILGFKDYSQFCYVVYRKRYYTSFTIEKKSGGTRQISSPNPALKKVQSALSDLLQNCLDELHERREINPNLSHGFMRERSIITNAEKHIRKRHVLNIDLKDFFDSINFGRVRGYFKSNRDFELPEEVATTIAHIACYNGSLPQGSPCSPVITNLIMNILDIRLYQIAKKNGCTYTRYADDISFSTRKFQFPSELAYIDKDGNVLVSNKVRKEIRRAGFLIKDSKTRLQKSTSRQEVTGIVVNKRLSIKNEYYKTTRAMCSELFNTGVCFLETNSDFVELSRAALRGRLNHIDSVERRNRVKGEKTQGKERGLSARETLMRNFLMFDDFYSSEKITVLCEGKTDNVYLKYAFESLKDSYPELLIRDSLDNQACPRFRLYNYTPRTKFLLKLNGGTSGLAHFINDYEKISKSHFETEIGVHPVIVLLDNDTGLKSIKNKLISPSTGKKVEHDKIGREDFYYIHSNLYAIVLPEENQEIEDLFDDSVLDVKLNGKSFNRDPQSDNNKFFGKSIFSKYIEGNKGVISFSGFKCVFDRMVSVNRDWAVRRDEFQ